MKDSGRRVFPSIMEEIFSSRAKLTKAISIPRASLTEWENSIVKRAKSTLVSTKTMKNMGMGAISGQTTIDLKEFMKTARKRDMERSSGEMGPSTSAISATIKSMEKESTPGRTAAPTQVNGPTTQ